MPGTRTEETVVKRQWDKAYLRTISDEIPGENVRYELRGEPLRTDESKACAGFWQAVGWLETIDCPTGNSCDSLDDIVLVPKCCPSWIKREKYICTKTKNISASLVLA